jgi:hypothetical protein
MGTRENRSFVRGPVSWADYRRGLLLGLAEYIDDSEVVDKLANAHAKLYGKRGKYLGETSPTYLLRALLEELHTIDLHDDKKGGAAPVQITSVDGLIGEIVKVEVYIG